MSGTTANRKRGRPRNSLPKSSVDPAQEFAADEVDPVFGFPVPRTPFAESLQIPPPTFSPQLLDKLHIDSRVTTLKLVALFWNVSRIRLEERKVGQILAHAGLFNETHRGYELIPAVGALIEYYKRHAEKVQRPGDADKDREKKANAGIKELKFMELAGDTIPRAAAQQFWSDARVELRKCIEQAGYLTKEQKKELLQDFQGLKTKLQTEGETE